MNFFDVCPRALRREIPKKIEYDKAENRPNAQQMKINQTLMESNSSSWILIEISSLELWLKFCPLTTLRKIRGREKSSRDGNFHRRNFLLITANPRCFFCCLTFCAAKTKLMIYETTEMAEHSNYITAIVNKWTPGKVRVPSRPSPLFSFEFAGNLLFLVLANICFSSFPTHSSSSCRFPIWYCILIRPET